jgi:hypothetical protein
MSEVMFNFELKDTKTADEVVKDYSKKIAEWTKGKVLCEIIPYEGEIESCKKSSFLAAVEAFAEIDKDIMVDIQRDLGEQSDVNNKYEVCLTVKGLEYYKYRVMFIGYGAIAYPVNVVMNEDIAKAYGGKTQYRYVVESMNDLEEMVEQIFATEYCRKLIQSLIYEAMRQEQRSNNEEGGSN